MKLDPIDNIILIGQGSVRSLECIFAIELPVMPDIPTLKSGAEKAQKAFPKTGKFPVEINNYSTLETFTNEPLESLWHLKEGIIRKDNKLILALKMSHVLGDAVSMILWLKFQLGEEIPLSAIKLQTFPPKKDSEHRHLLPSKVWPSDAKISSDRKMLFATLEHEDIYGGFSINDILSLSILRSLPVDRKSLWVPVNIREKSWEGFGNGLSRMRIYPSKKALPLREELSFIKRQKKEARISGEIFSHSGELNLEGNIKQGLFKLWLNRPWADWGSLSFSHLHDRNDVLSGCDGVWGVTNIPEKQQAGIFAFTKKNKTWLTLTMDALSFDESMANHILSDIQMHFHKIKGELK